MEEAAAARCAAVRAAAARAAEARAAEAAADAAAASVAARREVAFAKRLAAGAALLDGAPDAQRSTAVWRSAVTGTPAPAGACALHAVVGGRRAARATRELLAARPAAAAEADADGWLPLHVAAYRGCGGSPLPDVLHEAAEVVASLLAAHPEGASCPELTHAWLPLHLAVVSRASERVINSLLAAFPAGATAQDRLQYTPAHQAATHGVPEPRMLRALCGGDCAAHRAVSLGALERFAREHDAWHMPTWRVVRELVAPATDTGDGGAPLRYASLLPPSDTGPADVFVSHAWGSPFGLLVAAAREFAEAQPAPRYANESLRREAEASGASGYPKPPEALLFWLDMFAVQQHASAHQAGDLAWLSPVVRCAPLGTLLVAEAPAAPPLSRAWCLYELAVTMQGRLPPGPLWEQSSGDAGALNNVRLTVFFGTLAPGDNAFVHADDDMLAAVAARVDAAQAQATVAADLEIVHTELARVATSHAGEAPLSGVAAVNALLRALLLLRAPPPRRPPPAPQGPRSTVDCGDGLTLEIDGDADDAASLARMLAEAGLT
jgi:hypothetical protein